MAGNRSASPTAPPTSAATEVPLPGDRRMLIREVDVTDAPALMDLYDGLDPEDRHRRFFCFYRPPPSWFAELADVAQAGGARLVAELDPAPTTTIVAEAGYVLLPSGNGDLGMVVDRRWRGWLGPYLLGRLVETAAAHGVPNLEADVLATNGPMLALLHRRGAVVVEHDGWSTVRLRIGTATEVGTWDGCDHPRILVETPGGRWSGEDDAHRAGLAVLTCPGPSDRHQCPALAGRTCPLVAGADAVVVRYPGGDERWSALVEAHRVDHPGVALLLEEIGTASDPALLERLTSLPSSAE